jgi:hypothetical protein
VPSLLLGVPSANVCHPVRKDSIDLQDRDAPSAQTHTHLTGKPAANGSLGSHQAETLREVAAETAQERRVSWNNGDIADLQQYAEELASGVATSLGQGQPAKSKMIGSHQQDALAIAQNGGGHDIAEEDLDDAGDDMDDDMMDKISSSPSIEDGWCTCSHQTPLSPSGYFTTPFPFFIHDMLREARLP